MIPHTPVWPHGDPATVARAILAQPAYRHGPVGTPEKTWLERLLDFLGSLWHRLTDNVHIPSAPLIGLSKIADVVLFAVALTIVAVGIFRLANRWTQEPRPRAMRTGLEGNAGAADLRAQAERAAALGDYARAIALLFGAALRALDQYDLVAFDPARTPGEYRRLLRRTGAPSAAPFDDLSGRFVRASFAPGAPSRDEYEGARHALAALEFEVAGA